MNTSTFSYLLSLILLASCGNKSDKGANPVSGTKSSPSIVAPFDVDAESDDQTILKNDISPYHLSKVGLFLATVKESENYFRPIMACKKTSGIKNKARLEALEKFLLSSKSLNSNHRWYLGGCQSGQSGDCVVVSNEEVKATLERSIEVLKIANPESKDCIYPTLNQNTEGETVKIFYNFYARPAYLHNVCVTEVGASDDSKKTILLAFDNAKTKENTLAKTYDSELPCHQMLNTVITPKPIHEIEVAVTESYGCYKSHSNSSLFIVMKESRLMENNELVALQFAGQEKTQLKCLETISRLKK
jgi:hypothetical protein